jgi:hypothetical protein
MHDQRDLFAPPPPPFQRKSDTSRAAADSLSPRITAACRRRVYTAIKERGARGATDQELQAVLRLKVNVETPRRWELVNAGLVKDSGKRRKTPSGRTAAVWVVVPLADEEHR